MQLAEGTFVALLQLLHKLVLRVGLEVQGNGVARMLADETAGYTSLLLRMGHPGVGSSGGEGARLSAPRLGRRHFFFFF